MADRTHGPRADGTGDRWERGDMTYTVNDTSDPAAGEGGFSTCRCRTPDGREGNRRLRRELQPHQVRLGLEHEIRFLFGEQISCL